MAAMAMGWAGWKRRNGCSRSGQSHARQMYFPCAHRHFYRHRIWPGEGSTVQWKWSPPTPGSLKAHLLPPLLNNVQTRERKGYKRGTARNFLQSFPLSGTLVVQSYRSPILGPATTQNLVVKFDGEICGGVLVENASDDFPSKRSSKISCQTSPEVCHQFRRKLRRPHSGNRWCLHFPFLSEVARPRVFTNCHPDPPQNPPSCPPKLASADLSIALCTPAHSHTRRGGSSGISKGALGGGAIHENPGFPVSKPGVSQSQVLTVSKLGAL